MVFWKRSIRNPGCMTVLQQVSGHVIGCFLFDILMAQQMNTSPGELCFSYTNFYSSIHDVCSELTPPRPSSDIVPCYVAHHGLDQWFNLEHCIVHCIVFDDMASAEITVNMTDLRDRMSPGVRTTFAFQICFPRFHIFLSRGNGCPTPAYRSRLGARGILPQYCVKVSMGLDKELVRSRFLIRK